MGEFVTKLRLEKSSMLHHNLQSAEPLSSCQSGPVALERIQLRCHRLLSFPYEVFDENLLPEVGQVTPNRNETLAV
jgi:hypothetical protein